MRSRRTRKERKRVVTLGLIFGVCIAVILVALSDDLESIGTGTVSADEDDSSDNSPDAIKLGAVDHAVWGYVTDIGGDPVPNSTAVNLTVFHVDHYTVYPTSGTSGGWYSHVLGYGDQGTDWDVGDTIWVNVTHAGFVYVNQTTITSASNQQIDVHCDVPIPEFPGLIVPIVGTVGLVLVVGARRARRPPHG